MTGRELVSAALRLIGASAPGESLSAGEATDGLAALNRMLGSWSNDNLLVPYRVREEFSLVAGQQSYTIGVSGNFNTARPMAIENAFLLDESQSPAFERLINVLNQDRWAEISIKGLESEVPTDLFMNDAFPQATIYIYPKPTAVKKLVLFSLKPISTMTLDTVISFPPGYERALIFNLAIDLAPEYGRTVADTVVNGATESKAAIQRTNIKPTYLAADPALLQQRGLFNILTGGIQ